jgi:hypothetical protein
MSTKTITITGPSRHSRRIFRSVLAAAAALAGLSLAGPASAFAAPVLDITSTHQPKTVPVPAGTHAVYRIAVSNISDTDATSGNITVDFTAPPGLEVTRVSQEKPFGLEAWACSIAGDSQSASCEGPEIAEFAFPLPIGPGEEACHAELFNPCHILVTVQADSNAPSGPLTPTIEACGGGAAACATATDTTVDIVPFDFRISSFDGGVLQPNGDPATQAGSRPDTASTGFSLRTGIGAQEEELTYPLAGLKDASVKLPPGLIGNPQAVAATATCTEAQLESFNANACPPESQVGVVDVDVFVVGPEPLTLSVQVFTMDVSYGLPALFGFNILGNVTMVYGKVRTGDDYGATVTAKNAPETLPIGGVDFTFWGVPADPSHDTDRGSDPQGFPCSEIPNPSCSHGSSAPLKPFVTLPTSCVGPVETFLDVSSWRRDSDSASFLSHDNTDPVPNPIGNEGCNAVDFSPSLQARPTTNVADAPSGLDVDLHVPLHESCEPGPPVSCENAEANLKDTTVTLPEGMTVNPSGANGLGACSEAQLGFTSKEGDVIHTTPDPATCPEQAKLGTVEVDSPLVDHPLQGAAYIAQPHQNPFGSLLALYITLDDPQTGTVVKLAGEIHADPGTGQLTTTVLHNPQLPFEDFKLHFFGGSGGALRTPSVCGTYSTTSSLTPWSAPDSGPPATPSDPWAIAQAPGGGTCPTSNGARPNTPDLDAGSVSPIAASYSPAVVNLRRQDGSQEFSAVTLTLPPGMTGKLTGVPYCSDAALATAASKSGNQEKASPSCPAASRIGTVDVAAGAGPAPYNAQGIAYLTGPYKGAPLGMAIITPATAGPFDLGTVVVRVALHLDPTTGQITATSDPIPSILQGIPLDIRSASVKLDRPSFTRNGTSCNPLAFNGQLTSTLGQVAPLSERFQLGECTGLGFKPKLGIRLTGSTKRGGHPALTATLTMPEGGANLAKAVVALPHSEFLDQAHIGTVCTRVQFAADQCPAASVYGHAIATSPLVDYAVEGPVYLRSSSNKLPDLVLALKGPPSQPIEVQAVGRVDSIKGGIRTSFEGTPDLPVAKVVLSMEGGRKGLLQNSTNICRGANKATAELDGQNGKVADLAPELKNGKCAKAKKKKHKKHSRHGAGGTAGTARLRKRATQGQLGLEEAAKGSGRQRGSRDKERAT